MADTIVKIKDQYFIWSSIVDAPISYGMNEQELTDYIRFEQGQRGVDALPPRMERVRQKGTSSLIYKNMEEEVSHNRAGPHETCLTIDELYEEYGSSKNVDK